METRVLGVTQTTVVAREKLVIHFEENFYTRRILEEF